MYIRVYAIVSIRKLYSYINIINLLIEKDEDLRSMSKFEYIY